MVGPIRAIPMASDNYLRPRSGPVFTKKSEDHFDCFDCVNCDSCDECSQCEDCSSIEPRDKMQDRPRDKPQNKLAQDKPNQQNFQINSQDSPKTLPKDQMCVQTDPRANGFSSVQPRFSDFRHDLPKHDGPSNLEVPHDHNDLMFCHWSGHEQEVSFQTQTDLDRHLKEDHHFDQAPICQWDSCDLSLDMIDDLLSHIKKDHITNHPHYECADHVHFESSPNMWAGQSQYSDGSFNHTHAHTHEHIHSHNHENIHNDAHEHRDHNHTKGTYEHWLHHTPTPQQLLKCHWDSCEFNAKDSEVLNSHIVQIHGVQSSSVDGLATSLSYHEEAEKAGVSPFQCEWKSCDFESLNYNDLLSHQQIHSHLAVPVRSTREPDIKSESPSSTGDWHHRCLWVCGNQETCSCEFDSAEGLSKHLIEQHVGSRKSEYVCNWKGCDRDCKPFQQRQKIIRHLQTHSKNKPFVCSICGHHFGDEAVLKQHLRVHSGEKPFECKICHKRFAASTALSVHLRIHTGEKPLKCRFPGCNKRFSESSNLNKHMKTHYSTKLFVCQVCDKHFTRQDQLQRHIKTHSMKAGVGVLPGTITEHMKTLV